MNDHDFGEGPEPYSQPDTQINEVSQTQADEQKVVTPSKYRYINASKVKKFALEYAKANRAHKFSRVSADFLAQIDAAVKNAVISRVKSHPSVGKTLQ